MTDGEGAGVAIGSRVHGTLFGLAVADALGAPLEFKSAARCRQAVAAGLTMGGGGLWDPGEWSDDTDMALALAESLVANGGFDLEDIAGRYIRWADSGPKDIGITTGAALKGSTGAAQAQERARQYHEATGRSAGNGTVMRCAPLAFAAGSDAEIGAMAVADAALTHFDPAAGSASSALCAALRVLAAGDPPDEAIAVAIAMVDAHPQLTAAADAARQADQDSLAALAENQLGACWTAFGVALFAVTQFDDYASGVGWAIGLGGDTDTNGAVAGALLGCRFGIDGIPPEWRDGLAEPDRIERAAEGLGRA